MCSLIPHSPLGVNFSPGKNVPVLRNARRSIACIIGGVAVPDGLSPACWRGKVSIGQKVEDRANIPGLVYLYLVVFVLLSSFLCPATKNWRSVPICQGWIHKRRKQSLPLTKLAKTCKYESGTEWCSFKRGISAMCKWPFHTINPKAREKQKSKPSLSEWTVGDVSLGQSTPNLASSSALLSPPPPLYSSSNTPAPLLLQSISPESTPSPQLIWEAPTFSRNQLDQPISHSISRTNQIQMLGEKGFWEAKCGGLAWEAWWAPTTKPRMSWYTFIYKTLCVLYVLIYPHL